MAFDLESFGERIKDLRIKKGLTIHQLANALDTTHATVSRWENGLILPKADSIYKIAECFAVTSDFILGLRR